MNLIFFYLFNADILPLTFLSVIPCLPTFSVSLCHGTNAEKVLKDNLSSMNQMVFSLFFYAFFPMGVLELLILQRSSKTRK